MKRSVLSSRFLTALQICLLVMVGASLVATTGCSWFHKKKPPVTEAAAETPSTPATAGPADNGVEGHRPGELAPFPELHIIYFDFDKATIRKDQSSNVEENLQYLLAHPQDKVLIEGHCDERGTVEYNFSLGEKRAASVRDYYLKGGVPAERIAVISKGEEEPANPGHNEAAWKENRRAAFKRMY